ncbi:MAG: metallophosphoesterase [Gemmatimonadota bacterium]|jgi:predicted MPP superfamily phosphohydrolase
MDRRVFLRAAALAGGAAAGAVAYGGLVEPRRLEVTRHRVAGEGVSDPLTLVQLSDLHLGRLGAVHEKLTRAVVDADPDLVLLTGDTVEEPRGLGALDELLGALPGSVPLLAVLGNWEYWGGVEPEALASVLRRRGGRLLVNQTAALSVKGRELVITGLDDLVAGRPDPSGSPHEPVPGKVRVLLAHCPAQRDLLEAAPFDLMLSGHTHGGQVDIAGIRVTPPGSGRYVEGWYREGGPPLYVSRGVGTSFVPLRIGARPEVAVFQV